MFEFHPNVKMTLQENGNKDLLIRSPTITLIGTTSHPAGPEIQEMMKGFSGALLNRTLPGIRHQHFARCWDRINYPLGE